MFTSSSLSRLSSIANISDEFEALSLFKIETSYDKDGISTGTHILLSKNFWLHFT